MLEVVFRVQREWEYMYSVGGREHRNSCNGNGEQSSPFSTSRTSTVSHKSIILAARPLVEGRIALSRTEY